MVGVLLVQDLCVNLRLTSLPWTTGKEGQNPSLQKAVWVQSFPAHRNAYRFEMDLRRNFRKKWVSGQAQSSYVEMNLFLNY